MDRIKKLLFEDLTIVDNIENVAELRYVKILRYFLITVNVWPGEYIGEGRPKYMLLHSFLHILSCTFCLITQAAYLWVNWEISFYELGHTIITLFMTIVAMLRMIMMLPQSAKYRILTSKFLTKMHLLFFKNASEYAMETYRKVHLISHCFTLILTALMFGGITLYNVIPMWKNYAAGNYKQKILYNSTYEHSLYLHVPVLKIYTHFDAYMVAFTHNWLISYICSTYFCMVDLVLFLMVFNVLGHLKILLHDLETFPLPANNKTLLMDCRSVTVNTGMYSEDELKLIFEKLKRCIDYHRLIKNFTDEMSDTFGPILLSYYMFFQVSGCLLLLECSQMTAEALIRYLPLAFILFQQLILLSVIFEMVATTSEKLKDAVYCVPWEYMDTKNRKIVSIFLYNVQEPLSVKAMGVVNVGVTTMATILKTSFSYFMFLRSV